MGGQWWEENEGERMGEGWGLDKKKTLLDEKHLQEFGEAVLCEHHTRSPCPEENWLLERKTHFGEARHNNCDWFKSV